ncbi:hypothetical protein COV12_03320 [Candidatus Woesearchaeota archaeon CG10_big_fil_rev_8_21_14_0_10_32_24]|nr:MAG: hypothetical protein COV12_03320 [Candidatus Woesearchaeota archaeon CG10_big_fil_rev_8_21_14_0_10_32_24]
MQLSRTQKWLLAIFIITLVTRLILAFTVPNLTYDSYFHLRQVEEIGHSSIPLFEDPLSYGGRTLHYLPFFHYVIALLNLFLPLGLLAKIVPNVLISLLPFIVFALSKKISNNETAALFSAFISGFLPVLFSTNAFTPLSLFLPVAFFALYCFLNIDQKGYALYFLISFFILTVTSSATFLIIVGFMIYLILSVIEKKKIKKPELELIIFSVFFYIWIQFIFFKKVLISQGIHFIWQNVPTQILTQYFPQISILNALLLVSIIPFLAGIFVVYQLLFQSQNQKPFLFISLVISTTLLSWLRLIEFNLALSFFAIILAILFSLFYVYMLELLAKTKISEFKKYLTLIIIILLLPTTILPSINFAEKQNTPLNAEIDAFKWLNENTAKNAKIVGLLEEGNLITYYSQRKNLMDDQFNFVENSEDLFSDLTALFATSFETQALDITSQHGVTHLVLTPHAQRKYEINNFRYQTSRCFKKIYNEETKIYRVDCILDKK